MSRTVFVAISILAMCVFSAQGWGQDAVEEPAHLATADLTFAEVVDLINDPDPAGLLAARALGLAVFSTPFNSLDGHGDGPFIATEENNIFGFGARPTAQGNGDLQEPHGQFLRVGGLDAQSCNECHVFVSHRTLPPTLGLAGVGGVATSAFPGPTLFDVADSLDDRGPHYIVTDPPHLPDLKLEHDGVADYNGRMINPPFLYGGGGVELLAKEMTFFLQEILAVAKAAPAGKTFPLVVPYGIPPISFGSVTSLGDELSKLPPFEDVELDLEGIGLNEEGLSTAEQLVVRPFGRKGENFTMRDFDRGAMMFHFGIQPDEVFDFDQDLDGMTGEVTEGEMTALHSFDVTNPRPVQDPRPVGSDAFWGSLKFGLLGCAYCHRPELWTVTRNLPLAHPEVPDDPHANVYAEIDLVDVGFTPNFFGGVKVPLFSDLKRHDMGEGLTETAEEGELVPDESYGLRPILNDEFITARLWGIADTNPYLHDGRATTLHQAILMHGGEAEAARNNYAALPEYWQLRVIKFLRTLRTPENPNVELLP